MAQEFHRDILALHRAVVLQTLLFATNIASPGTCGDETTVSCPRYVVNSNAYRNFSQLTNECGSGVVSKRPSRRSKL